MSKPEDVIESVCNRRMRLFRLQDVLDGWMLKTPTSTFYKFVTHPLDYQPIKMEIVMIPPLGKSYSIRVEGEEYAVMSSIPDVVEFTDRIEKEFQSHR